MIVLLCKLDVQGIENKKPPFGALTKGRLTCMWLCNDYMRLEVTLRLRQCGTWTDIIMSIIIIRHMLIVIVCVILSVALLLCESLLSVLSEGYMLPSTLRAKVDNRFCIAKYLQTKSSANTLSKVFPRDKITLRKQHTTPYKSTYYKRSLK